MLKSALIAIVFCCSVAVSHVEAQQHLVRDYFRDYVHQVPRKFSPDDPWTMGKIMRTEVGFGGFFFNCDGDQDKRYSPYINWNCQNSECCQSRPVRNTIHQQWEEIKQRIRWGSCNECDCGSCAQCQTGGPGCILAPGCAPNCTPNYVPNCAPNCAQVPPRKNMEQTEAANVRRSPPAQITPVNPATTVETRARKSDSRALIAGLLDESRMEQKAIASAPVKPTAVQQSRANRRMVTSLLHEVRKERTQPETAVAQPAATAKEDRGGRSTGFLVDLLTRRAKPDGRGIGVPQPVRQVKANVAVAAESGREDNSKRASVANRPAESDGLADEKFRMIRR